MLFDSHAHLSHPLFDNDREQIILELRSADIKILNIGADLEESKKAVELVKKYPDQMWASVGVHPNDAEEIIDNFDELNKMAADKNVVAIGECGLDYFRIKNDELKIKETQKNIFVQQIELAKELGKPLIIHCRPTPGTMDAYEDAIEIFKFLNLNISSGNGVAHFFSGTIEIAKKFLDLGFYISFAGPITFHPSGGHPKGGSSPYKELVEYAPVDKILIETDSPFAAPVPFRGQRNEPAFVKFVAQKISEWKNLDFDKVATQTHNNAKYLFKI